MAEVIAECREEVEQLVWSDVDGIEEDESSLSMIQAENRVMGPNTPRGGVVVSDRIEEAVEGASTGTLSLRELRARHFSPRSPSAEENKNSA